MRKFAPGVRGRCIARCASSSPPATAWLDAKRAAATSRFGKRAERRGQHCRTRLPFSGDRTGATPCSLSPFEIAKRFPRKETVVASMEGQVYKFPMLET